MRSVCLSVCPSPKIMIGGCHFSSWGNFFRHSIRYNRIEKKCLSDQLILLKREQQKMLQYWSEPGFVQSFFDHWVFYIQYFIFDWKKNIFTFLCYWKSANVYLYDNF